MVFWTKTLILMRTRNRVLRETLCVIRSFSSLCCFVLKLWLWCVCACVISSSRRYLLVMLALIVTASVTWLIPWMHISMTPAISQILSNSLPNSWETPTHFVTTLVASAIMVIHVQLYPPCVLFLTFFPQAVVIPFTLSQPIPGGFFIPLFLMGGCVGRCYGEVIRILLPDHKVSAAAYAIVGGAGLASGVTRAISTAVVVFELTAELTHILPVLVRLYPINCACCRHAHTFFS